MARPRKNAARAQASLLPPDEVVEIPVEEQPYPLPKGWKWVRLYTLCSLRNGKAFKPSDWSDSGLPIIRIQNLNNQDRKFNYYSGYIEDKFLINSGDLLFAWSGTLGAHIWYGGKAILNQHIFRIDFEEKVILKSFFRYAINCRLEELIAKAHGGAGLQHVTKGIFENTPIPLPTIDVQQRIVERIESLFAKLDEAKAKAESVLDGFEIRKAAILHKAFTGELTAKWREENKLPLSNWKYEAIASLCHSLKYGTAKKSKETGSTVVLRMGNLQGGEIDWSNLAYSDDQDDIQKYLLSPNDILFNRTNSAELVGKTSIYRGEYPAIYAGYLIKMDYKKDRLIGSYLNYIMNSLKAKEYCNSVKTDGVNQSNINAKKLGAFIIPVPCLSEQQEIVRILDNLLAKEQQAKEAAETVLNQIDLMKKAILARAFRGELTR
ncbi:restriction endonuclease subunit S [Desulfovibrio sp. ZJ369]|uniref:restriction endonuclease subunit S n=1 Tax=Desulfovibrio sp. ZJ369 TaxID=2709793 RepID=UPI0013EDD31E|nr:restriction endonuclease subunit S [Desulfovibrio sp. ZJ369]